MDLTLAGLTGAFAGAVIAWINYFLFIGFITRRLNARNKAKTPEERLEFAQKLSLARRLILGFDIVVFVTIGYWLGSKLGG
jgi:hypothetical protein